MYMRLLIPNKSGMHHKVSYRLREHEGDFELQVIITSSWTMERAGQTKAVECAARRGAGRVKRDLRMGTTERNQLRRNQDVVGEKSYLISVDLAGCFRMKTAEREPAATSGQGNFTCFSRR